MKNIGFKLWRWVGRKCGWYYSTSHIKDMITSETPEPDMPHDPEMWTETKAVEKK